LREAEPIRIPTGVGEMDRVLGGGLVPGSAVLLGGGAWHRQVHPAAAGRGRAGAGLRGLGGEVLYATGEESAGQVRLRAGRLDLLEGAVADRISVVAENDVGRIVELTREARPLC